MLARRNIRFTARTVVCTLSRWLVLIIDMDMPYRPRAMLTFCPKRQVGGCHTQTHRRRLPEII